MIDNSGNYSDQILNADPVGLIAAYLAGKFVTPLFNSYKKHNYQVYVRCLAEILNWSQEFYDLYYNNKNEKDFKNNRELIYHNGIHRSDFLSAWADKRIRQYLTQHKQAFSGGVINDTGGKKEVRDGKQVNF
jgi:hypothetical protein